ncbi:MAG TPA: response regulator, partial [bacterium]|nr:response regulator [bacterium]
SVEVAEDGNAALAKLKEHNPSCSLGKNIDNNESSLILQKASNSKVWPDVVLLDIVLPSMDGWEILKRIKEDKIFKDLKVIILSNLSQKEEIERGLKLGAIKYIIKAHHTPSEIVKEIKNL